MIYENLLQAAGKVFEDQEIEKVEARLAGRLPKGTRVVLLRDRAFGSNFFVKGYQGSVVEHFEHDPDLIDEVLVLWDGEETWHKVPRTQIREM